MNIINKLLGIQSPYNEEMEQAIENFKNIDWFANCGKLYHSEEYYNYIQEEDVMKIDKMLDRVTNYKNFVCLRNLFIEASHREENYILRMSSSVKSGKHYVIKILETINNRFLRKNDEIDFDSISKKIIIECNLNIESVRLELYRFFQNLLLEIYFKNIYVELPLFFNRVFDIYINGHLIIGWQGRFETHDVCIVDRPITPIDPSNGKLIIF